MASRLYGRVAGWLCLSALCGYMAFHALEKRDPYLGVSNLNDTLTGIQADSSESHRGSKDTAYLQAAWSMPSDDELCKKVSGNNEYLAGKSSRLGISADSGSYLSERINYMLRSARHDHRKKEPPADEKNSLGEDFSPGQKLRIYLMLKSLKDTSFCNNIGGMIYRDITDKYAEHGGIVDFGRGNSVRLKRIPSSLPRTRENDNFYDLPKEEITTNYIALFHLHATTYGESDFAGPSSWDMLSPSGEVESAGEAHEFLITSMGRGRFNVDYYGGDIAYGKMNVLDLGTYRYTPADSTMMQPK